MSAVADIEEIQGVLARLFPTIQIDGDIGKITTSSVLRLQELGHPEEAREIQSILFRSSPGLLIDGQIGELTIAALHRLDEEGDFESLGEHKAAGTLPAVEGVHEVKASSFADPADVKAFRACVARGHSENYCFGEGDNGIGKWGKNTAQDEIPMVALPREVWRDAGKTGGAKVIVHYKDFPPLTAFLEDTMPALSNIHNGAGMDTNPAVAKAFGLHGAYMVPMTWQWA